MAVLPPDARKLIESDAMAYMATVNPDGSPQVSGIWVGLDGDQIVSGHLHHGLKLRNLERDPRLALTIEATGQNDLGLREYLVVRGTAEIREGGAPALLQQLAYVYLGPDAVFPPPEYSAPGYVLRITPERVSGMGPWAG